jgi:hypothetical protein
MKKILLSVFLLIACGFGSIRLSESTQKIGDNWNIIDDGKSPRCLSDAIIRMVANPSKVIYGQSNIVSRPVDLLAGCSVADFRLDGELVAKGGSRTVYQSRSGIFYFAADENRPGGDTEKTKSARLDVVPPDRVVIDKNTRNHVQVLIRALEQPNRIVNNKPVPIIVELCDVDLDMTGLSLVIGSDRQLIASPACARGPSSLGPRIFITDNRSIRKPLFEIRGDNVLFSGFRLEGPTSGIGSGDGHKERGITISPFSCDERVSGCPPVPIRNIEISNMEIFHWSGAGIYVTDNTEIAERGRLFNTNEGAVSIRNNFFHHNRHYDGYGYGLEIAGGAYALIEKNVFDENRHAIAGGSSDGKKDFSGYTARDNLILFGGGKHCKEPVLQPCWRTHQIDMHGNKSGSKGSSCCGTAGETIIIERNAIHYNAGYAIKIRGNPADKAVADSNVFSNSRSEAIAQNGELGWGDNITNPIDVRPNNVFGVNPSAQFGVCDFDEDGIDDLFLTTGTSWWFSSFGEFPWSYLNTKKERFDQVELGYFDNDLRCDVLGEQNGQWVISSGGSGDWQPFGMFGASLKDVQFGRFDPNIRDHRPGVTRRTTHAFRRDSDGQWYVISLSDPEPDWKPVQSSSSPMNKLQFGDFNGDGVTDVLAVVHGHWEVSDSAIRMWRKLNANLGDAVENLLIANMDRDDNIDDILRLEQNVQTSQAGGFKLKRIKAIFWRSKNGTDPWQRWKEYDFGWFIDSPEFARPIFGFAGRFGAAPGGGTLVVDPFRLGHFYSKAEITAGALPDWTSLFQY